MLKLLLTAALVAAPAFVFAHDYRQGAIVIHHPWARPALAGRNAAAYLDLDYSGDTPDRLLAASSPAAERVELHGHTIDAQGVARMRPVAAIDLPAHGSAELAPGSLHVMLIGLKAALDEGGRMPLTLTFERAGRVEVEVSVQKGQEEHGHGAHGS